jgi:hypothetical protein
MMSAIQAQPARVPAQSTFVNVVAWISIALSGMGAGVALLQFIMFMTLFNNDEMEQTFANSPGADAMAVMVYQLMPWFILCFLAVSVTSLVASIGMLRRQNWGRLIFIGILVLGIAWNVFGIVMQHYVIASLPKMPDMPDQPGPSMDSFMLGIQIGSAVFAAAICALHIWIIKRLMSSEIAAEFRKP